MADQQAIILDLQVPETIAILGNGRRLARKSRLHLMPFLHPAQMLAHGRRVHHLHPAIQIAGGFGADDQAGGFGGYFRHVFVSRKDAKARRKSTD